MHSARMVPHRNLEFGNCALVSVLLLCIDVNVDVGVACGTAARSTQQSAQKPSKAQGATFTQGFNGNSSQLYSSTMRNA